jgi:TRAP-type C4-dicarboxylate transport system permease small subunit
MLKSRKIALVVVTLLPVVYAALVTAGLFFQAAQNYFGNISLEAGSLEVFFSSPVFVQLNFFFSFLALILTLFYLIHIVRNTKIGSLEIKGLWLVVLLASNLATMLVYWFVHIWRDRETKNEM